MILPIGDAAPDHLIVVRVTLAADHGDAERDGILKSGRPDLAVAILDDGGKA
jgi:hypothetical protein